MRRTIVIAALALTVTAQAEGLAVMPDVISEIERAIEGDSMRAVSVGLYDNGDVQVTSFGRVSRTDSSTPQGDTVFEIGSITKVFTSLLTQRQVDAGRLSWDDTIASRLPEVEFASDDVGAISLRELSTHGSGLPRLPDNIDPTDPLDPYQGYDRELLLSFLAGFDPEALVKEMSYSNLGAGVLGVIAADAAELAYSEAMQRDVIGPLGMTDTGAELRDDQSGRLAQGFSSGADMPNWSGFDALAGAGALLSTADDMLAFIRHNFDSKALHGSLDAIREPQASGESAFGWQIAKAGEDGPMYWHNGGTGGYASFLAFRPTTGKGIVILSTSTDYEVITRLGFTQMSGEVADSKVVNLDPYPGVYEVAKGFALSISIDGGKLFAQATGQGAFPLTPMGEHEFVFPPADIRIVFAIDANGSAEKLTLYQGGQVTPAPRVGDVEEKPKRVEIALSEVQLGDYVGKYELAAGAIIEVLVRDGQPFAQLTGQAAYPIFAYGPDQFFYKVVDAQLHFERDDKSVIAVVLHQGGEQRAPRIE